jgi:hypothetical protein
LRQEQLFFALLRECLELGSITTEILQDAIRKNYLRKDAFRRHGEVRSNTRGFPAQMKARGERSQGGKNNQNFQISAVTKQQS